MKVTIYATTAGCEAKAKDPEHKFNSWEIATSVQGEDIDYGSPPPVGAAILAEVEVSPESVGVDFLQAAMQSLNAELTRKMAEAQQVENDLRSRIQNLLAITHESSAQ